MRVLRGLLVVVLLAALPTASVPAPVATVLVSGRPVAVVGRVTVQDVLRKARVDVPTGRVLSLVTHRPLRADHEPGLVLLDGLPVATDAVLGAGDVVTVVPGSDVTEPVQVVEEVVPANHGMASLLVGGRPGTARLVRGTLSGETTRPDVVVAPKAGHLAGPRAFALTFDDGPDPTWTPRVLALLAAAHVHATFCLVGREVVRYPMLVRAIVRGGHALCNHTWSHDEHLAQRPSSAMASELSRTQEAIGRATGLLPRVFRAPGGDWSAEIEREARRQGMSSLHWDVDPRDWSRPGGATVLRRVLIGLHSGAVVLLHDGGGDRSQTLWALQSLLVRLKALRYAVGIVQP